MKQIAFSIVIPVYNETESLKELVQRLNKTMLRLHKEYEFIFVDDGSTDKTFEELLTLKKESSKQFKIVRFRKNQGKSAAMAVGFDLAQGATIITLDADLQDDPEEFPKLLTKLDEGFDLVVGWRKNRQDPANKIRSSHLFNAVVAKVSHLPLHDINCGLKVLTKSVANEIDLYGELHRFIPLLAANRGFKVTEVEVAHHPRKYGVSKFGSERAFHAFFDLITTIFLTSFKYRPLQIFGPTGALGIFIGIIILLYLTVLHFMGQTIGKRPLLNFGILILLFGVQIFSTGLLGELISNSHMNKKHYPTSEIIT